jgi:CDP-diacylglycerol--glycerol-3-phosphate 3-phosphatidyltransferase
MSAGALAASLIAMNGLYSLKPWYARRLARTRRALVRHHVSPDTLTWTGVAFGAAAGTVLAVAPSGVLAALPVAALLAARLACANLDGGVARDTGGSTRFGAVTNELGDRMADLVALAGLAFVAPWWLVATAGLAATLPSWAALAGAAAGAHRVQGGPVGKTERCALLVIAAATGWYVPVLAFLAIGSIATAGLRLVRIRVSLAADAAAIRADDAVPASRRTDGSGSSTADRKSLPTPVMSR